MDKVADTLTTLSRFVLLLAAVLLLTDGRPPPDYAGTLRTLQASFKQYQSFRTEVGDAASNFYRNAAARSKSRRVKTLFTRAAILPDAVEVGSNKLGSWSVTMDDREVQGFQLTQWTQHPPDFQQELRVELPLFTLDLIALSQKLIREFDAANWPFVRDDVIIYVGPATTPGQCNVRFDTAAASVAVRRTWSTTVGCRIFAGKTDVNRLGQTYPAMTFLDGHAVTSMWNPYSADDTLAGLATRQVAAGEPETDVLGFKLGTVNLHAVGPGVLLVVLLMMLAQTRVLFAAERGSADEARSWLCQFNGIYTLAMIFALILLPTMATLNSSGAQQLLFLQGQPSSDAWWRDNWLPVVFGAATFLMSYLVVWLNAAAWEKHFAGPRDGSEPK